MLAHHNCNFQFLKSFAITIVLLFCFSVQAQQRKLVFQLTSGQGSTASIEILNLVSEVSVHSNVEGKFVLEVSEGDLLLIAARNYELKRYTIDASDFTKEVVLIPLIIKAIELDETVVTSIAGINARDLGIISPNTKSYTPAEARLKTAGVLKPADFLGLLLGGIAFDPILNAINGKTAALTRLVLLEAQEKRAADYKSQFGTEYFINQLGIPTEFLDDFLNYIANNGRLQHTIANGEINMAKFLISKLAVDYKNTHLRK